MYKLNLLIDAYEKNFNRILKKKCSELKNSKHFTSNYLVFGVHKQNLLDKDFLFDLSFKLQEAKKYGYTNKKVKIALLEKPQHYSKKEWDKIKEIEEKLKKDNVYLGFYDEDTLYDVDLAKTVIEKLEKIAQRIKDLNLSTFEKVMLAYSIAQRRVYTSESEIDGMDKSRSIYSVLTNEEIVCVGFAKIFKTLLEFLQDDNIKVISNSIGTTTKDYYRRDYHRNNIAYIKDESYGINGVYYFDPTWDCIKNKEDTMFRLGYFMLPLKDLKHLRYVNIVDRYLKYYPTRPKEEPKKSDGSSSLSKRKQKIKLNNFANQLLSAYITNINDFNNFCEQNSVSEDGIRILDVDFISKLLSDKTFSNIAYSLKEKKGEPNNIDLNMLKVKDKMGNLDILEELFKEFNIEKISKAEYQMLTSDKKDNPSVYEVANSIINSQENRTYNVSEKDNYISVKTVIRNLKKHYMFEDNKLDNTSIMNLINLEKGLKSIGLDYLTLQKAMLYSSTPVGLEKFKGALKNVYEKTTKLSKEAIEDNVNKIINYNKLCANRYYTNGATNSLYVESVKKQIEK